MTTSMSQHRWSLPRPARVLALWATIVIHVCVVGVMLINVVPEVFPIAKREFKPFVPLVDPPPPPPVRPEPEEIVVRPPPPIAPPVIVPIPPPPIPIPVDPIAPPPTVEPSPVAVAPPLPETDTRLIPTSSDNVGSGVGTQADLRSGIDYQCRRAVRYPRSAERAGIQGEVRLRAWIRPNGSLAALDVARSSGYGVLDRAAESWLSDCTFSASAPTAGSVQRVGELSVHFVIQ